MLNKHKRLRKKQKDNTLDMLLLLILPILVSGFIYCSYDPYNYYRIHRYEGQYLYFKSALFGINSLVVFTILTLTICSLIPPKITIFNIVISLDIVSLLSDSLPLNNSIPNKKTFIWIVVISLGSMLLSYCVAKFNKSRLTTKKIMILLYDLLRDSPIDYLFFQSFSYNRPILISLKCRKIYVGFITSLGEPTENEGMDQEISLFPLMSGYRDETTLSVNLDQFYDATNDKLNVIVRQDEIISASWFDFETYVKLKK